ncbi:hypothetical protein D3C72_1170770 [compost metagenome]
MREKGCGDEGALADGTADAVLDARAGPSTGFRPPFGLGRVTFLCVAKEKSPKERPPRQSAGFASPLGPEPTSDGPPQTAHPCAGCGYAIIPDGIPDVASDPRRIGGGPRLCMTVAQNSRQSVVRGSQWWESELPRYKSLKVDELNFPQLVGLNKNVSH